MGKLSHCSAIEERSAIPEMMIATPANGMARSGCKPNDAAYGMYALEVVSSRLNPVFAETSTVKGVLDLMVESTTRK